MMVDVKWYYMILNEYHISVFIPNTEVLQKTFAIFVSLITVYYIHEW